MSVAGARNNRVENSHQPVRRRERALQRSKSLRHAARFCSVFDTVCNQFRPSRHAFFGTQLSHGDAPALAGMGRRLGGDGVRSRLCEVCLGRTPAPGGTSLFKPPDRATNLPTPPASGPLCSWITPAKVDPNR